METIKYTTENVEQIPGESVGVRNTWLSTRASRTGVGPPDLVWLKKVLDRHDTADVDNLEFTGYYHWVTGLDVSSAATVAAYFADLKSNVEQYSFLEGLISTKVHDVSGGLYCCFDALSKVDLRCSFSVPGGVRVEAVDAAGKSITAGPEHWAGACVSAFLRAELLDLQTLAAAGGLRRFEALPTPRAEQELLGCVERVYRDDTQRARITSLSTDPGMGVRAEDWDPLCAALYHHFERRQRFEQAHAFFSRLSECHAEAAMYAAMAQHDLDLFEDGMRTLQDAARACPTSAPIKVALGQRLLERGRLPEAGSLAHEALAIDRSLRCAWLLLAETYAAAEECVLAFVAVNLAPAPPPFPTVQSVFGFQMPPPFSVTTPRAKMRDPELEEVMRQQEEEETDGSHELLDLPAAVLLPVEPVDSRMRLRISQSRSALCVLGAVYNIFVRMVDTVGWETFLEERGRAFLLSDDFDDDSEWDDPDSPQAKSSPSPSATPPRGRSMGKTFGQRPPLPPAFLPPAAPPPETADRVRLDGRPGIACVASSNGEASPSHRVAVNPLLWSAVYGDRPYPEAGVEPDAALSAAMASASLSPVGQAKSGPALRFGTEGRSEDVLGGRSQPSPPPVGFSLSGSEASPAKGRRPGDGEDGEGLEADRRAMLDGDVDEILGRKRMCVRWVDNVIFALYKDLSEYMRWIILDRRIRSGFGRRGDDFYDEGSADGSSYAEEEDDVAVPVLQPIDWVRRGLLCIRLGKVQDAERALRVGTSNAFSLLAHQALGRIFAERGLAADAAISVLEILAFHEKKQKFEETRRIPNSVLWIATCLVMVHGLQKVRRVFDDANQTVPQAIIDKIFHDVVEWKTDGFSS